MADPASCCISDQGLIALKRGTQLIKYSRKGKPKLKSFRLSADETSLIWNSHGAERHLTLSSVSGIIAGQKTPVFRRFLCPEKDNLSFSLIYNAERSLDLICKDKAELDVWLGGLNSLITTRTTRNRRTRSEIPYDLRVIGDSSWDNYAFGERLDLTPSIPRGKPCTELTVRDTAPSSLSSHVGFDSANMQPRTSSADGFRISVSSAYSSSTQGSGQDDIESLGDVYLWGEIWSDGLATDGTRKPIPVKSDILVPKSLESNVVLDVHQIACGVRHVALVTRQGEVFTWGEESGGRLGHGIERDFSRPRLVECLAVTNVDFVACGEFHTCVVSASGDVYSWGDGCYNAGLLGQNNDISHWIPKRVSGSLEGIHVLTVACGTWHSALSTSTGKLFTFGDGMFGALGHGDRRSVSYPKEVESLNGAKIIGVSCGVWHTAAIVEVTNQFGVNVPSRKLFTWGDGEKNRLGHGDKKSYLVPTCVTSLFDYNIHQLACGNDITVVLTTTGHVFIMGSNSHGQLGNPSSDGKSPSLVQDKLVGEFVEQISCGAHHVAVLTSKSEVFTWGRGANGRLGHGDTEDRNVPTLVEALKDKHVKDIACGSNYSASICIHKWVSGGTDQSVCTGCRQAFGFTRKRHNCYNCGLVHCHACSSKKAMRAALAPTPGKPHRVCDSCYLKLKKAAESGTARINRRASGHRRSLDMSVRFDSADNKPSKILLSPTVEPVKAGGGFGTRPDNLSIVRASQVPSLLQLKDIAFPSSLSALQHALKPVVTAAPPPPFPIPQPPPPLQPPNSRPISPYSRRPSPPRSTNPVFSRGVIDNLKRTNDHLAQEISKLNGQVRSLKQQSEAQDREIQKFKKKSEEANALAADKSSKCVKVMQTIQSITSQWREIRDKWPAEASESASLRRMHVELESFLDANGIQVCEDKSGLAAEDGESSAVHELSENADTSAQESNGASVSYMKDANGSDGENNPHHEKEEGFKEVIEQFEPGVYVTLILLEDGFKVYKRVRFSKRKFSEQQAEGWWKENKERVLKKYAQA